MRLIKVKTKYSDIEQWVNAEMICSVIYIPDRKEYSLILTDSNVEVDLKEEEFYNLCTKAGIEFEAREQEVTRTTEVSGSVGDGVDAS